MKTYADGIRACIAALRADVATKRIERLWLAKAIAIEEAADKLESTLLVEATADKPVEAGPSDLCKYCSSVALTSRWSDECRCYMLFCQACGKRQPLVSTTRLSAFGVGEAMIRQTDKAKKDQAKSVEAYPLSVGDMREIAAQARAYFQSAVKKAAEMGARLDERSRQRAEVLARPMPSITKPVEPPVCAESCGKTSGGVFPMAWASTMPQWCSPACRALGRPVNPAGKP